MIGVNANHQQLVGTNHDFVHKSEVDPPGTIKNWRMVVTS